MFAVFMYSQNDFSGFQHCSGKGGEGLPKIHNDISNKFMSIGYRYPEHLLYTAHNINFVSCLSVSRKMLARIEGYDKNNKYCANAICA